jgi:hypothetical protein
MDVPALGSTGTILMMAAASWLVFLFYREGREDRYMLNQ